MRRPSPGKGACRLPLDPPATDSGAEGRALPLPHRPHRGWEGQREGLRVPGSTCFEASPGDAAREHARGNGTRDECVTLGAELEGDNAFTDQLYQFTKAIMDAKATGTGTKCTSTHASTTHCVNISTTGLGLTHSLRSLGLCLHPCQCLRWSRPAGISQCVQYGRARIHSVSHGHGCVIGNRVSICIVAQDSVSQHEELSGECLLGR